MFCIGYKITFWDLNAYEDAIVRQEEDVGKLRIFKRGAERFLAEAELFERFYEFIGPKSVKKVKKELKFLNKI